LLPTGRTLADYASSLIEKARRAQAMGFRAAKLEVCIKGPYAHNGIQESDQAIVEVVGACREAVGPDFVLMVDVAYCWSDAKVARIAADRGRLIVPHCWKSGIGIAASAHLCAATACSPYIEFLPAVLSESAMRRELVEDELTLCDGHIPLPQKPGLGVELNRD